MKPAENAPEALPSYPTLAPATRPLQPLLMPEALSGAVAQQRSRAAPLAGFGWDCIVQGAAPVPAPLALTLSSPARWGLG